MILTLWGPDQPYQHHLNIIRNENLQVPPQTYWTRNSGVGPRNPCSMSGDSDMLKFRKFQPQYSLQCSTFPFLPPHITQDQIMQFYIIQTAMVDRWRTESKQKPPYWRSKLTVPFVKVRLKYLCKRLFKMIGAQGKMAWKTQIQRKDHNYWSSSMCYLIHHFLTYFPTPNLQRRQNYHFQFTEEDTEPESIQGTFPRLYSLYMVEWIWKQICLTWPQSLCPPQSPPLKKWAILWECLRARRPE